MNKCLLFCSAAVLLVTSLVYTGSAQATKTEEAVALDTPTGRLYGTLMLPKGKAAHPVVLIIAGSGPTDRNGNSALLPGQNNSLKMLAEGLAASGIASLRYDKRGIAESAKAMGKESDLRFDTYVDDAVLWCKQLRADKRFSTLTIAGHSEGSLIGMIAAQKAGADAYVSIAGLGRPAGQIILDQVRPQFPPDLMKTTEAIVADLTAGKTVASIPPQLVTLFRPSVQPYLISWFRYDPSREITRLTVPVLIVQGTTDIQVTVNEAKLLAKAAPRAKLLVIDGMNHVLKLVPSDKEKQIASYSDPSLAVAPQLVTSIVTFVKDVRAPRH